MQVQIQEHHLKMIQNILKNSLFPGSKVWVFGSRARGTARRASDLDLAIDANRALDKKENAELFHAFEESDLPYKVDVVDLYVVNDNLKKIIDQEKKPLIY